MEISIRPARRNDALHVAAVIDIAGHGIEAPIWAAAAGADGSPLAVARSMVIDDAQTVYHFSRAQLLEVDGEVAGGLIGGLVTAGAELPPLYPDHFIPLLELENRAVGFWAIIGVAIYPEHRGRGLAGRLMEHAESLGRAEGAEGLSLVVEDTNEWALGLYRQHGFIESDRRPWLAYGQRSGPRNWLLLTRTFRGA